MSNNLLQMTSNVSRAENSLSSTTGNESELVRQLRNRISQMEKDLVGIHAMAFNHVVVGSIPTDGAN